MKTTTTSAKIVADSVSPQGARITTLQLVYPRIIHSEFMTHRVFSRNAMSSRAIPIAKILEQVRNDPFIPTHWGKNQPGMQAREELQSDAAEKARAVWVHAARRAADSAEALAGLGLHKQIANRLLEPFQWMHTVVTATEWSNFFKLRCHPDAEPHIQALAEAMRAVIDASTPVERCQHTPYVDQEINSKLPLATAMELSSARCARVSYKNHDGTPTTHDKDVSLADTLAAAGHWSPFEHAATSLPFADQPAANYRGWRSYRNFLEGF